MTALERRCLGCGHRYPTDAHACPRCASHAGEIVEDKPKPVRRRATKKK